MVTEPAQSPSLEFWNVSVKYPGSDRFIIKDATFSIFQHERAALIGLNGSGKTSLLTAAAGLIRSEGVIKIGGIDASGPSLAKARDRLGFVFSTPADQILFPRVIDDVSYSLIRRGCSPLEALSIARQTLGSLGAEYLEEYSPFDLSDGETLRIAIAGAMVANPSLLLLDEPSGGLDAPGKRSLLEVLRKNDAAMLIATHDLGFAKQLCTSIIAMENGRVRRLSSWTEARSILKLEGSESDPE